MRFFSVILFILLGGCIASKKPYVSIVLHFQSDESSGSIFEALDKVMGDIGYVQTDKNAHSSSSSGASTTYFFQRGGVQCVFTLPRNGGSRKVGITLYPSRPLGERTFVVDGEKLRDALRATSLSIERIEFDVRS